MTAQELYYEHRDELTKEALQVLEKIDNYTLSTLLIDGDASDFNLEIEYDPHSYDRFFDTRTETERSYTCKSEKNYEAEIASWEEYLKYTREEHYHES